MGFYGGEDLQRKIDWVGFGNEKGRGFCVTTITEESINVSFINIDGDEIHSTVIKKD